MKINLSATGEKLIRGLGITWEVVGYLVCCTWIGDFANKEKFYQ